MVVLYEKHEIAHIKEDIRAVQAGEVELGQIWADLTDGIGPDLKIVKSSGRATRRLCGKKIKMGENALSYCHDFTGNGSWTAVDVYIHWDECPEE